MNALLFIQDGAGNIVTKVTEAPIKETIERIDMWDLAVKGGWLIIPVVLLLFISLVVLIERIIFIKGANKENPTFMNRIRDYICDGKIDSAINLCQMTNTPVSRIIEKGISRLGHPVSDVLIAIENVRKAEIAKLKKGFTWLSTTAAAAPMLGFLGTISGMLYSFFDMASAGTKINRTLLSVGIFEALVTTAAGLIVGIIALFSYSYLASRVNKAVNKMEIRSMEFMDFFNELAK